MTICGISHTKENRKLLFLLVSVDLLSKTLLNVNLKTKKKKRKNAVARKNKLSAHGSGSQALTLVTLCLCSSFSFAFVSVVNTVYYFSIIFNCLKVISLF